MEFVGDFQQKIFRFEILGSLRSLFETFQKLGHFRQLEISKKRNGTFLATNGKKNNKKLTVVPKRVVIIKV